jgi:hypothetical protein
MKKQLFISLLILILSSCSKESKNLPITPPTITDDIYGTWHGIEDSESYDTSSGYRRNFFYPNAIDNTTFIIKEPNLIISYNRKITPIGPTGYCSYFPEYLSFCNRSITTIYDTTYFSISENKIHFHYRKTEDNTGMGRPDLCGEQYCAMLLEPTVIEINEDIYFEVIETNDILWGTVLHFKSTYTENGKYYESCFQKVDESVFWSIHYE